MRRRDDGFTLLEILVAMAILASILPAVMIAFTTSARSRSESEHETTAAYLLRDKLSEMEAIGQPEEGEEQGDGDGVLVRRAHLFLQVEGLRFYGGTSSA